jgi:N6-L-threonylcarbamoyladenine synthase
MKKIFALETSCDDTAAAIVDDKGFVLGEASVAKLEEHNLFGGVVPEIGSRAHIENILPVAKEVFKMASLRPADIDGIAATFAPGLVGPLLVGAQFAKGMAQALNIPLLAIHHIEGHIFAGHQDEDFPTTSFLALIVSGGHTALYGCDENFAITTIGETLDDAAGEAFDKIGRALDLGYPAGAVIDNLAKTGDREKYPLPIAMRKEDHFNFSFSGLKTKALEMIRKHEPFSMQNRADFCASIQEAVAQALCEKSIKAALKKNYQALVIGGGVAANSRLRELLTTACKNAGIHLYLPKKQYCTDNAVMIAKAAHIRFAQDRYMNHLFADVLATLPIERIDEFRAGHLSISSAVMPREFNSSVTSFNLAS